MIWSNSATKVPFLLALCLFFLAMERVSAVAIKKTGLATGWGYVGCYGPNATTGGGDPLIKAHTGSNDMTVDQCLAFCQSQGYPLAGLGYRTECFCDNNVSSNSISLGDANCMENACPGSPNDYCGPSSHFIMLIYSHPTIKKTGLSNGWGYKGCFGPGELGGDPLPTVHQYASDMTVETCLAFCESANFPLAGLQYGSVCFCASAIASYSVPFAESVCAENPCPGSLGDYCGPSSTFTNLVYSRQSIPKSNLATGWNYTGCYVDTSSRMLSLYSEATTTMSVESCIQTCSDRDYIYAAVQDNDECYCDSYIRGNYGTAPESECSSVCTGSVFEYCGGVWRNQLYTNTAVAIKKANLPSAWNYQGCYVDQAPPNRALSAYNFVNTGAMNITYCINECSQRGYSFAGVQYQNECWCDHSFHGSPALTAESECSHYPCPGSHNDFCGGDYRMLAYKGPAVKTEVPGWTYSGCYADSPAPNRILSYQAADQQSVSNCVSACTGRGFSIAGLQYGGQCFCGNAIRGSPAVVPVQECMVNPCPNQDDYCGAGYRMLIYLSGTNATNSGTISPTATH
ncbi:WSC domain-containing protein [Cladochytrium replicatum]|nr:WSC domain-containing protein [Cladochytrium replicatum]